MGDFLVSRLLLCAVIALYVVGVTPATAVQPCPTAPNGTLQIGINLALASFGKRTQDRWSFPQQQNLNYYIDRGFRIFRIAVMWERLQPTLNGELDENAVAGLNRLVSRISEVGGISIIDMHNYMRRGQNGNGSDVVGMPGTGITEFHFADVWSRIADQYRGNCLVWFGLMNEPHHIDPYVSLHNQNVAIAAIRKTGARNFVLVSGNDWSNAYSWMSSGNGMIMSGVVDQLANFAYDIHQYLDPGKSGSSNVAEVGAGRTRLIPATQWLREHHAKGFLGEFGAGRNEQALVELRALLNHLAINSDVWVGGAYWAGGGGWSPTNEYTTDPADYNNPSDRPQTTILREFLQTK